MMQPKRRLFVFLFLFILLFCRQDVVFALDERGFMLVQARRDFATGMQLYQQNNFALSIEYFQRALERDSQNSNVRYFLGLAYYRSGYTQRAISQWKNLIKIHGDDAILQQKIETTFFLQPQSNFAKAAEDVSQYTLFRRFKLDKIYDEKNKAKVTLRLPVAIDITKKNEFIVLDAASGVLAHLDRRAKLKKFIIGFMQKVLLARGRLEGPSDFVMMPDQSIVIADFSADQIVWLDALGDVKSVWDNKNKEAKDFLRGPKSLSLDSLGNVLVVDSGVGEIKKYNQQGLLIDRFGKRGSKKGEMKQPNDIFFHPFDEKIYVVDRGNRRIQRFDRNGYFEQAFGAGTLKDPRKIAAHPHDEDKLMVLDVDQVYQWSLPTNEWLPVIASSESNHLDKDKDRLFLSLDFDHRGRMYVGNAAQTSIDSYLPMDYLYSNLNVHFENIDLQKFPQVIVELSVRDHEKRVIADMDSHHFQIFENGVERPIKRILPSLSAEKWRPVVLVEKSLEMEKNKDFLRGTLKKWLIDNKKIDRAQFVTFGGEEGAYEKISTFTNLYRMAIEKLFELPYHQDFSMDKALHAAVNFSLSHAYRKAIVVFAFEPYDQKKFGGSSFQMISDFALHNHVPIYIIYKGALGAETKKALKYTKLLAKKTGGKFYIYNRETISDLMEDMNEYRDGVYRFMYQSSENRMKKDFFRPIEVRAKYFGLQGIDNRGGYTIP